MTLTIDDGIRSRVSGAYSALNYGVRPAGALTGGLLATAIGLRPTLLVAAAGGALSVLWLIFSPVLRIRTLDQAPAPPPVMSLLATGPAWQE